VLFVRHGATPTTGKVLPGQAPGLHLSEEGRAQAARTAESIARLGSVTAIYSSPMERTKETAAAIGAATGIRPKVLAGLADPDAGEWTNKELKALYRLPEWRTVQRHPSGFRFPGGESFSEVAARVTASVDRIVSDHAGQTVVAVSHADAIRIVLAGAMGSPLDLWDRLTVGPASVSAVAYRADGAQVLCMNVSADGLPVPVPKPAAAGSRSRKATR
jgi:probable phosphoglycerate mutase